MRCLRLLFALLLLGITSWAQQRSVSGKVLRKDNQQPLAGVTIETKKQTVITDGNGNFSLIAEPGETYAVSFVGFKKITEKVPTSGDISLEIETDIQNLDEVVVVGYTTEKKKDLK